MNSPIYIKLSETERIEVRVIGTTRASIGLMKQDRYGGDVEWSYDDDAGIVFPASHALLVMDAINQAMRKAVKCPES